MEELLERTLFGVMTVILTALIMIGSIFFSEWLFSWGNHSPGIDMVYLPAGVRLLLVLRFRVWAAIGIALATPIPALFEFGTQPGLQVVVHALINGFALWLTVEICARLFRIQPGKIIYPLKDLLILTLVVSIALPIAFNLEYLLFAVRTTDTFLTDVAVMSLGDLMGCALVILPVVLATQIYLRVAGPFKPTA